VSFSGVDFVGVTENPNKPLIIVAAIGVGAQELDINKVQ
jgi:hypothetical protein